MASIGYRFNVENLAKANWEVSMPQNLSLKLGEINEDQQEMNDQQPKFKTPPFFFSLNRR